MIGTATIATLMAIAAPANLPTDIFVRDAALGSMRGTDRLIADVELGRPGAEQRLEGWLRRRDVAGPAKLDGFLTLCGIYFLKQRYADGVRVCGEADRIKAGAASNMTALHRAMSSVGGARWSSNQVTIHLKDGQLAQATRAGVTVDTLIDTGAEIGVVTESVARSLGARRIDAGVEIGTTTAPVAGGLVVFDSLRIGDGELRNMTAVVLSDRQAAYSGLKLVVPLQALVSLGRLAFVDHGRRLLLGAAAPRPKRHSTALYWDQSGIGFAARFASGVRGVHFDTGSRRTWLFPAAAGALSATELATRRSHQRKIGGVGGERTEDAALFRDVSISIAGHPWTFREIEMAQKDENGEAARIGTGLFDRFSSVALDFQRMRMSVED